MLQGHLCQLSCSLIFLHLQVSVQVSEILQMGTEFYSKSLLTILLTQLPICQCIQYKILLLSFKLSVTWNPISIPPSSLHPCPVLSYTLLQSQCVCCDNLKHLISHCDRKYQKQVFRITALNLNLLYLVYMVQVLIDWLVNISVYLVFYEGMSSVSIVTVATSTFWSMGLKTIFRISRLPIFASG